MGSLWSEAWRRLRRNPLALAGGSAIVLLALMALGADWLAPTHYTTPHFEHPFALPNGTFLLGTDQLGRDVLSRMIYGAQISLTVGVVTECLVLLIGVGRRGVFKVIGGLMGTAAVGGLASHWPPMAGAQPHPPRHAAGSDTSLALGHCPRAFEHGSQPLPLRWLGGSVVCLADEI